VRHRHGAEPSHTWNVPWFTQNAPEQHGCADEQVWPAAEHVFDTTSQKQLVAPFAQAVRFPDVSVA
jgi:hypothetical protein